MLTDFKCGLHSFVFFGKKISIQLVIKDPSKWTMHGLILFR